MVSDGREASEADGPDGREPAGDDGTGSPIVDRWLALDRGWQALALGLGIVAVHVAIGVAAAPF